MNRGGGWNGGRSGGSNGGNGGGGPRGRNNNRGGSQVRFPSDQAARKDGKFTGQNVRFPSDSNARDNQNLVPSFLRNDQRKNEGGPGPGPGRDNRSRDAQGRDQRPGRDQGRPQDRREPRRDARGGRDDRGRGPERVNTAADLEVAVEPGNTSHIDPFELFCAYHLGLTVDGAYRTPNINDVARRFNASPGLIKQALLDNHMDMETVTGSGFDLGLARMDVQVSPPGVSKREIARGLYDEFLETCASRTWPEPEVEEEPAAVATV